MLCMLVYASKKNATEVEWSPNFFISFVLQLLTNGTCLRICTSCSKAMFVDVNVHLIQLANYILLPVLDETQKKIASLFQNICKTANDKDRFKEDLQLTSKAVITLINRSLFSDSSIAINSTSAIWNITISHLYIIEISYCGMQNSCIPQ